MAGEGTAVHAAGELKLAVLARDGEAAERAFRRVRALASGRPVMEAAFLLWQGTGKTEYLEQAWRYLETMRERAPERYRESMVRNVPLHRDVEAAWQKHGYAS